MIKLKPCKEFTFPIVADCINPDTFQDKTVDEIGKLAVWEGNKERSLGELFKVEPEENTRHEQDHIIVIEGNASKVKRIGSHMKKGEIKINGDVGMHLGEEMKGGKITVHGNVGGWAGSMMKGGEIQVNGNVGDYLCAPYRGSTKGMQGGKITVHGNVGNEAGAYIKKGIIKVYGNAGPFVGFRMQDGTIYVQNDCGERAGACMANGRIVVGGHVKSILPTLTIDSIRPKVKVEENEVVQGPFYLFLGDIAENGHGRFYANKQMNPYLSRYEEFL